LKIEFATHAFRKSALDLGFETPAKDARRLDNLLHGHAVIDDVKHRLQHTGWNPVSTREAERKQWLAVLLANQRRDAAGDALAGHQ
jgi:hypothetical protein